jgi:hypothetical protein
VGCIFAMYSLCGVPMTGHTSRSNSYRGSGLPFACLCRFAGTEYMWRRDFGGEVEDLLRRGGGRVVDFVRQESSNEASFML